MTGPTAKVATGATGPTPEEVARCDPLGAPPPPPPPDLPLHRCLRADQVPGEVEDRRFVDTRWILNGDEPVDADHFLTTHRHFFSKPGTCPPVGGRRARLLWHYLLHRHALRVGHESISPPEVEPYVTEYSESYIKDDFKPVLEAELERAAEPISELHARYPLYEDPPCSYWYQKQMLPPRGACWDRVTHRTDKLQPFRRNAVFSTPLPITLYDDPPTEVDPCRPRPRGPRFNYRVNHNVNAPYDTPTG